MTDDRRPEDRVVEALKLSAATLRIDAPGVAEKCDEALAALDTLLQERDAARFVNGEDIPSVRTRSELYAALKASEFKAREWKDKAQDKIAECVALEAERDQLRERLTGLVEKWKGLDPVLQANGMHISAASLADELESIIPPKPEETG